MDIWEKCALVFSLSLVVIGVCGWIIAAIDDSNPRRDYVAERKRRIDHNGFKSRMGAR
jgi:hypothetical protein